MAQHPFSSVAIAGVFNTKQARSLPGETSVSIQLTAAMGVIEATGIKLTDIDGLLGSQAGAMAYSLGLGPAWVSNRVGTVASVADAASLVATKICSTVLITEGSAGVLAHDGATAAWTRPTNEYVAPFGMYTAAEFALIARRHMAMYGTTSEQLATVAATIRNNGHINPDAVYYGRGPFTVDDVLASRMVADPFHLLDCAMTAEGGAAMIVTTADRAKDLKTKPVYILGAGTDSFGDAYHHAPSWDLTSRREGAKLGLIGQRAASQAFSMAGLKPSDVQCCEFYDPFSFEIIRQFEAFGFCGPGEGGDFVMDGNISPDGRFPVCTDGGTMSHAHSGSGQLLQKAGRSVEQIQGVCKTNQIGDCEVSMSSVAGAGALYNEIIVLGAQRP